MDLKSGDKNVATVETSLFLMGCKNFGGKSNLLNGYYLPFDEYVSAFGQRYSLVANHSEPLRSVFVIRIAGNQPAAGFTK